MNKFTLSTDCVIFLKEDIDRKVLLIQRGSEPFKGQWALPGGMLEEDETLEQCASRELQEETGLEMRNLRQVGAFSAIDRDPRGRVITVAFYGVIDAEDDSKETPIPVAASDAADLKWFLMDRLPELAFDHNVIVEKAFTLATNHSSI